MNRGRLQQVVPSVLTHAEREMLWIDGWNDLHDAVAKLAGGYVVNEDWAELTVEECKGLIQQTAYTTGKRAQFLAVFHKGEQSIQVSFA